MFQIKNCNSALLKTFFKIIDYWWMTNYLKTGKKIGWEAKVDQIQDLQMQAEMMDWMGLWWNHKIIKTTLEKIDFSKKNKYKSTT
jgi:hypothetical protein